MDTIVACGMCQNAAPHILEWIAFHRLIGVDRFVLYDRGSDDGTAEIVARSRFARQVTVIARAGGSRAEALADFLARHAAGFTFVLLADPGEFLHPLEADTIRALLPRYAGFSAVMLRRLHFAPGYARSRPGQLVIGSSFERAPDGSPLNDSAPVLFRVADLQGVQDNPAGDPAGFAFSGAACDAGGRVVAPASPSPPSRPGLIRPSMPPPAAVQMAGSSPAMTGEGAAEDPLVVNCYRAEPGVPETVPDRRIARFIPRLRAMLHDAPLFAASRCGGSAAVSPGASRAASPPPSAPAAAAVPGPSASVAPSAAPRSVAVPPSPAPPPSPLLLGIGVVTYNRCETLRATLDRIQQHTKHPRTVVAVADDGSGDGTLEMLRARKALTVTGRNRGVAWNKNRALFLLADMLRCDIVLLLEDDAYPSCDNWESDWMLAARRWGHVNVAADWLRDSHISGTGTLDDPVLSHHLTAQCAVFSREALLFGGYFDTRFHGYGHEHVEHSWRLLRMGYGGSGWSPESKAAPIFKLIRGGIAHASVPSVGDAAEWQAERNRVLAQLLLGEYSHRGAFQNEEEAKQLREELRHSFPVPVL